MTTKTGEETMDALEIRVRKLERFNRVLLVALIGMTALLGGMAAVQKLSIPEVVNAHQFQLVDKKGRVHAELGLVGDLIPMLKFYGPSEPNSKAPPMMLLPGFLSIESTEGSMFLQANSIKIEDKEGFSVHMGTSKLVRSATGEKSTTSAASIVLFDKSGNVIWRAR